MFQVVLSIPLIIAGWNFYRIGFPNLFKGSPNMDSLIGMGTSAAFLYSFYATGLVLLGKDPEGQYVRSLYFETAAVIIAECRSKWPSTRRSSPNASSYGQKVSR